MHKNILLVNLFKQDAIINYEYLSETNRYWLYAY